MKILSFALLLVGLTYSLVARAEFEGLFISDSMGTSKCAGNAFDKDMIQDMIDLSIKEIEKQTGYTECKNDKTQDVSMVTCLKPMKFARIITRNQAACHKFMFDNGIKN